MVEYSREMLVRDQQETEFECMRQKQKRDDLNPWKAAYMRVQREQDYTRDRQIEMAAKEVEERRRDQEMADIRARDMSEANLVASSHSLANTGVVTNDA